ncbi:hypothetical protein LUZ60_002253 [Juncus effusus]|nr:hypothetical protein LUZ60_002253 [Juncus effusus]
MQNRKDLRRTVTLSQQLMEPESPNQVPIRNATGHWDGLSIRSASGRTLFDIIQQDDNWKPVKDQLRLQRVGAAFSDGATIGNGAPPSVVGDSGGSRMLPSGASSLKRNPTFARTMSRSVSTARRMALSVEESILRDKIVITEITDVTDEMPDEPDEPEEEPPKGGGLSGGGVSLMSLLEQTNNRWGSEDGDESDHETPKDDDEQEEEEETEEMYNTCCVCMVQHKGLAFVPCGHTFCRLCSRELRVSSGNCPLCNGFVQEILDIF